MTEREFLTTYSAGWSWDMLRQRRQSIYDPTLGTEVETSVIAIGWTVDGVRVLAEAFPSTKTARHRGWIRVHAPFPPLTWHVVQVTGKNPPPGNKKYRYQSPYDVLGHQPAYSHRFDPRQRERFGVVKDGASLPYTFRFPERYFEDPAQSHRLQADVAVVVRQVHAEFVMDLLEAERAFENRAP